VETDRKRRSTDRVARHQRLTEVIARNRSLPVFAGQLTETRPGIVTRTKMLRWVVLDPCAATLSIWNGPPADDDAYVGVKSVADAPDPGEVCGICLESTCIEGQSLSSSLCGHWFHDECLERWRAQCAQDPKCPTCRCPLDNVVTISPPQPRPFGSKAKMQGCIPRRANDVLQLIRLEEVEVNPQFRTFFLHFEGRRQVITLTADVEEDFQRWHRIFEVYSS